jgi:hypothetical protein
MLRPRSADDSGRVPPPPPPNPAPVSGSDALSLWSAGLVAQAQLAAATALSDLEAIEVEIAALAARVAWQSPAAEAFRDLASACRGAARTLVGDVDTARDELRVLARSVAPVS